MSLCQPLCLRPGTCLPPRLVGAVKPRTTHIITIPAAAFNPTGDSWIYANLGDELFTTTGLGTFAAPLFFETPAVTVNSITLYGYDNNAAADVCVYLQRSTAWNGGSLAMGSVCSTGASTADRNFTNSATLNYRTANGNPYLWLVLPSSKADGYAFYRVRINDSY